MHPLEAISWPGKKGYQAYSALHAHCISLTPSEDPTPLSRMTAPDKVAELFRAADKDKVRPLPGGSMTV
jgi:hypothetical protein